MLRQEWTFLLHAQQVGCRSTPDHGRQLTLEIAVLLIDQPEPACHVRHSQSA